MPERTGAGVATSSSARCDTVSGHEAVPLLPSGQQLNAGSRVWIQFGESEGDNELL